MPDSNWQPCAIIPVYNHERAVGIIVEQLLALSLPVILVNDGSSEECTRVLREIDQQYSAVTLIEQSINQGKGAAVKAGLRTALAMGFSHGLQIDADGQHRVDDVKKFLDLGQQHPQVIIAGCPVYAEDVPRLRFYGRYLTHVWVHINTLSFKIKDSMCGFRLYPVAPTVRLIDNAHIGNRMDFDSEILVRWIWQQGDIINLPTEVSYPLDGVSHFSLWGDNVLISKMHARLFFEMLWRLPVLLKQKFSHQPINQDNGQS